MGETWSGLARWRGAARSRRGDRARGEAYATADASTDAAHGAQSLPATLLTCCNGWGDRGFVAFSDTGEAFELPAGRAEEGVRRWQAHAKSVSSAECSRAPQGPLVTGARDLAVRCWDQEHECLAAVDDAHELSITAVACHPREPLCVASGSRDTSVKVWDLAAGAPTSGADAGGGHQPLCTGERARNIVTCMRFVDLEAAAGPPLLAQGAEDMAVRLWDWKRAGMGSPAITLQGYQYFSTCMDAGGDGAPLLLTGCKGFDGTGCDVLLWDLRSTGAPLLRQSSHQQEVVGCALTRAAGQAAFASVSKDNRLLVHDLSGRAVQQADLPFTRPATGMAASATGDLFTCSIAGEVAQTSATPSSLVANC